MFVQPSHIPTAFAFAVYAVMHNRANYETWELIDQFPQALQWIEQVLVANETPRMEEEMDWWQKQLNTGDDND